MVNPKIEPKPSETSYNIPVIFKQMGLLAGLSLTVIAILFFFFLPQLASDQVKQVITLGKSQASLVAQMSLNAVFAHDQNKLNQQLANYKTDVIQSSGEFMQISVILHPSGFYYSSTNPDFVGQKSHPTLIKQLASTPLESVRVTNLPYQLKGEVKQVYQFLKAVNVSKDDQLIRIATVQVLIGYEEILRQAGWHLLLHGLWITLVLMGFVWLANRRFVRCFKRLTLGMHQISAGHLEQAMPRQYHDEPGQAYLAFNQMTHTLKAKQTSGVQQKPKNQGGSPLGEISLRKANLSCLCARIPQIQDWINSEKPDHTAKLVQDFLKQLEVNISENGGQIIKVLGNKVYTLFEGLNGINNSLRASLKLSTLWSEENHQRKVLGQPQLDYGLGVHAASGLAGTLGLKSSSYTVIGDAASVAEYLCSCSGSAQALVTQSTLERANVMLQQTQQEQLYCRSLRVLEEVFVVGEIQRTSNEKISLSSANNEDYQSTLSGDNMPGILEETLTLSPLDLNLKEEQPIDEWKTEDLDATSKASFWEEAQVVEKQSK